MTPAASEIASPDARPLKLFRGEVFSARDEGWLGDVCVAKGVPFLLLFAAVLVAAAQLLAYAIWGEYTRKIRVSGYVVPSLGAVKILPAQSGQVTKVLVKEGQRVKAGDPLVVLSSDKATSQGDSAAGILQQIDERIRALRDERERKTDLYETQIRAARVRIGNYKEEISRLDASLRLQQQRVAMGNAMLETHRALQSGGFVSGLAMQQKEQDQIGELAAIENARRSQSSLLRELEAAESDIHVLGLRRANDLAELRGRLAALEQERIEGEVRREFLLRASQDGVITAIVTDVGRIALPTSVLLTLVPSEASVEAEAYLPSRAAGFVKVGSTALLQFQAFPYQKFGSHSARVTGISRVAVPAAELSQPPGASAGDPVYIAKLSLEKPYVMAYGRQEPLKFGMGFEANVTLDKRTLLEWLFEPVYSVSGSWAP